MNRRLTLREYQVLTGLALGMSNAALGRRLYLSEATIKTHARQLFRKLGAANRAHAVALGFRRGLLTLSTVDPRHPAGGPGGGDYRVFG